MPSSTLNTPQMGQVIETLDAVYLEHPMDILTGDNPYKVLMACILSLRTKDEVTMPAAKRLFALAETPQEMVGLEVETIQQAIFPVGFYKTKAQTLIDISRKLLDDFSGEVPKTIDELLTLKGVGRKTANLVVGLGHRLPAICVDVHVHRISNRLGYIRTKTPDETEMTLREILPQKYWPMINKVMVLHGQQCCKPVSPLCHQCPVEKLCLKIDVKPRQVKTSAKKPASRRTSLDGEPDI